DWDGLWDPIEQRSNSGIDYQQSFHKTGNKTLKCVINRNGKLVTIIKADGNPEGSDQGHGQYAGPYGPQKHGHKHISGTPSQYNGHWPYGGGHWGRELGQVDGGHHGGGHGGRDLGQVGHWGRELGQVDGG
ncbi:hypothetical protein GN156_21935, partial [bacterium LRH843]|nr:hypothetical protein [bacterium LRH843]